MEEKRKVVRNYKDTVFRMLYRDKKELLALYNALNGTDYQNPEELETYTLENAIYMAVKNDVSFLLGSELNLYEHQASFNPNMALRDLLYISRQLEKYIREGSLYSGSLTRIPVPRFVVFYNGNCKQPERQILKLSDAFEKRVEDPELELKVLMLNINVGNNNELMEKCRTLKEYSEYVACVREHASKEKIEDAVEHAVTECIQKGILSDFLTAQRSEVVAMSIFEYNEEEEMRKIRKAEYECGLEEGRAKDILLLLEDLGNISKELHDRIMQTRDQELLGKWLKLAARAKSIEDFAEAVGK
ncbi:MAG: hypothetical protein Q4C58_07335 [Eubacteriales bacterium]|nr:hypothetical protein [Eubacteriales bacterium]